MDSKMQQAREWADDNIKGGYFYSGDRALAAAEVIQSLPDQWIDAEELRELIDTYKHARDGNAAGTEGWVMNHLVVRNLESLLPAPPLPTLADMTPEEREACQWMQADFKGPNGEMRVVVTKSHGATVDVLLPSGAVSCFYADTLTPLPDLPRLEWPDSGENGSVPQRLSAWDEIVEHPFFTDCFDSEKPLIESMIDKLNSYVGEGTVQGATPEPSLPRPEDVPPGEAWLIRPHENADPVPALRVHASKYGPGKRWAHYRVGGSMLGFADDEDVTLVSRLVPEHKENA